jgi:uncharacterized protein with GYD domain
MKQGHNHGAFHVSDRHTPESWAAPLQNPQNRVETVVKPACAAVGRKLVGGWYCFAEYDVVLIMDLPDGETMSAVAMAVTRVATAS